MPRGNSWLMIVGGVSAAAISFFVALEILDFVDGRSSRVETAFRSAVVALNSGKPVNVWLDDSPAEDREQDGQILCGPGAANGYLGALIAGERYDVVYLSEARSWTTAGPYQVVRGCGRYSETYGPSKLGPNDFRPEKGDLVLWGAHMTFDTNLVVYDATGRKVGHLSIGR
jgi:hypothetical protein